MWDKYHAYFDAYDMKKAAETIMKVADDANKYIEDKKPWVLAKEDMKALGIVLYNLLEVLRHLGYAVYPYMPETSEKMLNIFSEKPLNGEFETNSMWGKLKSSSQINGCDVLFPRLD